MLERLWRKTLEVLRVKRASDGWHRITGQSSGGGWLSWLIEEPTTGAWQRNEEVSVETSLANPTLYACVTLITGDISKVRPKLVEQDADGIWDEVSSAAFSPVLNKPNHYQNRIEFFEWWMLSKLTHGNTYALKARDGRNVVTALYILDPTRVTPLVAPDGSVFYDLEVDELAGVEPIVVPAREMIHDVCCPLWHPLCGVSPIFAAGAPALHGLTMRTQSRRFFANGAKPGGVLTHPGEPAQATIDRLNATWASNFSGENAGKVAILSGGLAYQPIGATAQDSDLVNQLGYSDEDIARVYGVPRYKVGIGPDPNPSSVEALTLQYFGHTLQKYFEKLELCLEEGLELSKVPGRTLGIEFERDDLIQMDTATQIKTAREAIQAGASPNEVRRRWLFVGPVEGGQVPFLQNQMWPIDQLASRQIPTGAPPMPAPPAPPVVETVEAEPDQAIEGKALEGLALVAHTRARLAQKRLTEAA